MSASLSEFFAAFKRALPICPSIQNRLNQPEILRNVFWFLSNEYLSI